MENLELLAGQAPETLSEVPTNTYVRISRESASQYRGYVHQEDGKTFVSQFRRMEGKEIKDRIPIVTNTVRTTGEVEVRLEGFKISRYYILPGPNKKNGSHSGLSRNEGDKPVSRTYKSGKALP